MNGLGTVYGRGAEFHAHINLRDGDGKQTNIYGPSRATENEAQKDLDQIRAAGGVGATREEGLKIMAAEARRIKMSAEYQSQIQETIQRRVSMETIDESDYEDERSDEGVSIGRRRFTQRIPTVHTPYTNTFRSYSRIG